MGLPESYPDNLCYYIVEDIYDVVKRLQHEMQRYKEWKFAGSAQGIKQAIQEIGERKPHLIFCDWDLVGGSGFEVLQHIQNMREYQPFIIFNTGFQSDHPEIAEELVNTYKPDAFIGKPYWHKLTVQLEGLLYKAKLKSQQRSNSSKIVWLTDIHGNKCPIDPQEIICVLQPVAHPRAKTIYSGLYKNGKEFFLTWKEVTDLLVANNISFFVTNKRFSIVVRKFIESYYKPYVYLKGLPFKVEIVEDYFKDFEQWLVSNT